LFKNLLTPYLYLIPITTPIRFYDAETYDLKVNQTSQPKITTELACKNSSDRDSLHFKYQEKNNALHIEPFIKSGILSPHC
jgi:hypothetical protein